jgi:hypothetical protein
MAAETRWVEYSVAQATSDYLGATTSGVGTRGEVKANNTISDELDRFTIGPTNNILNITVDGGTPSNITLTSGVNLDARFITRDVTEKMHAKNPTNDRWKHATCEWVNNQIHIYSGNVGAASSVAVSSGTNTAYNTLGFASNTQNPGTPHSWKAQNGYIGGITVSGIWEGMFDEVYTVIINKQSTIGAPTGDGGGFTGTFTAHGQYNHGSGDSTYTITIDVNSGGATVGGGSGGVPRFSWTSTGTPDNGGPVEILYSDHWYNVGTRGLKVKWTDDVFIHDGTWSIACTKPIYAEGSNGSALPGTAQYVWTSTRGDECSSQLVTSDTTFTRVGTRGLYMKFIGSNNLSAGDEFRVVCTPPQPSTYDINSLNYGNVTVTTESPVKCVLFEIMGGAAMMTSVKFGLQNHGSFSYHNPGDTYFRYGTIGGKNTAGGSPTTGKEWRIGVTADDLSGTKPTYLYAVENNLSVVATADDSESIGNYQGGLVSDFVYLCIRLGADETGSNSSINYRLYFDYS